MTIKNKLTKQQIFDKVWERFVAQKRPLSFFRLKPSNIIYCTFYGPKDARDPIGMFIPRENYEAFWMDDCSGLTVYSFLVELKLRNLNQEPWTQIFIDNESLFEDLQKAHDDVAKFVKPYRRLGAIQGKLISVAKRHKLHYGQTK